MTGPFQRYAKEIRRLYRAGVPENTYVPALAEFLRELLEGVAVIPWPNNEGVGLPDIGIKVNAEQVGLVEAEALDIPLSKNNHGRQQAEGYSRHSPTVLTNFYEFVLIVDGEAVRELAIPYQEFLSKPINELTLLYADSLKAFLNDWASRRMQISSPEYLADRLADYAQVALQALVVAPKDALSPLRVAMEEALGIKFVDSAGEHLFRSSLVQTLFYGIFSAWIIAAEKGSNDTFSLYVAAELLRVPIVASLFAEIAQPIKLGRLNILAPVEWAIDALRRVAPGPFLASFESGDAIQYFYEPFLAKFDPELRKSLGVWYTPKEIVRYQVQRVHELLESELHMDGGLMHEDVIILDAAAGTGSYLLQIAKVMYAACKRGGDPFPGVAVKDALKKRVFGFELLTAPFVIAHLQIGLFLDKVNAEITDGERLPIFLTNSLMGWRPSDEPAHAPIFPELAREREQASLIKLNEKVLVFIGNPPYDRFAGLAEDEGAAAIADYKIGLRQDWGIRKQTLDDLYIRFIRLAEGRVADHLGKGIVSYITNRSYLTGISHPVMRDRLLRNFDSIYIDDLHGAIRAKRAGDGSVFTAGIAAGIRIGVAVAHMVRKGDKSKTSLGVVHYREFLGTGQQKRTELLRNVKPYEAPFTPSARHRMLFRPLKGEDQYWTWPAITSLFPARYSGVQASRDDGPMDVDRSKLAKRFSAFFDPSIDNDTMEALHPSIMKDGARYNARKTRNNLLQESGFLPERIVSYLYRPFDMRFIYWEAHGKVLVEKRKEYFQQVFDGNMFLISGQTAEKSARFDRVLFSRTLVEFHALRPDSRAFPWKVRYTPPGILNSEARLAGMSRSGLRDVDKATDSTLEFPNSGDFFQELLGYGLCDKVPRRLPDPCRVLERYCAPRDSDGKPSQDAFSVSRDILYFTVAILSSIEYGQHHAEYLAEDWPRIPLPRNRALLARGSLIGQRIATLMDMSATVEDLPQDIAVLVTEKGTYPAPTSLAVGPTISFTGDAIQLSNNLQLRAVPADVWNYAIGGYQVLKKWLDYRRGGTLAVSEARDLIAIVRRIRVLCSMSQELDSLYLAVIKDCMSDL